MNVHPIRAWNRFWFAPVSAKPLGAFRILFGLVAISHLLLLFVDLDYWLTDRGILQGNEAREIAGPLRTSILHTFQDPTSVRVFLVAVMATAVGLTLGWHTRIMSILFYVGMLSIHHRNIATASGADVLVVVTAFNLMFCPSGAAYSLDALRARKKRGGTLADPLIIPWGQRLLQIQVCILYLTTAIFKTAGPTWLNGTALHYVLCNREVGRFDLSALAAYPLIVNVLTYAGLVIEYGLALFLWSKSARPWVMAAGISLHAGILFVVNIPIFGELATASYLVFLTSSEWESLRSRFNPIGAVRRLAFLTKFRPTFKLRGAGSLGTAASSVRLAE
jgi:hypothetical protein